MGSKKVNGTSIFWRSFHADGLDGVVAAETILSHTDRANGMVWVRGHDLPALVAWYGFEGTVALLFDGFAGKNLSRDTMTESLGEARRAAFETVPVWLAETAGRSLFEGTRMAIAAQPDRAGRHGPGRCHDRRGAGAGAAGLRFAPNRARSRADDGRPTCCACCMAPIPTRPRRRRWTRISP